MQPTTSHCEFCGAELMPIVVKIGHTKKVVGHGPCHCEQAKAQREENLRRENEEAEQRKRAEVERKLARANIPVRYRDAVHPLAQIKADQIIRTKRGLWIYGPQGTLKTTLACAVGIIMLGRGWNVHFTVATKLAEAFRSRESEDRELIRKLATVKLLIVDDLDKVSPTPYACERFWDIFNDRYNDNLPVIGTGNMERGAIIPKFREGETGKSIASRLAEMTESIYLGGQDRRLGNVSR